MDTETLIREMLATMSLAIFAGDWKVDGACDPEMVMNEAMSWLGKAALSGTPPARGA